MKTSDSDLLQASDLDLDTLFPLDAQAGPAPRMSATDADTMIDGVLDAWQADRQTPRGATLVGWHKLAAAAAVLAAVTTSAAAASYFLWPALRAAQPTAAPATDTGPSERRTGRAPMPTAVPPAPDDSLLEETATQDTPAAATAPKVASQPTKPRPIAPKPAIAPAEDLLARGNLLRGQGRWRAAEAAYLDVVQRYPRSLSAYVAQVAAASLRLERLDDPRGAQQLYRAAAQAQHGGSLHLEIQQGLARAARQLGDVHVEVEALQRLITSHSGTPAARHAQTRLDELAP